MIDGRPIVLRGVRIPAPFLPAGSAGGGRWDIGIADGQIRFVESSDAHTPSDAQDVRLDRALVWPCLVEAHTHLDSAHIWPRSPNPDGTFAAAAAAQIDDRERHWSLADMRRRMDFGLRTAFAHGVRAMRTHLASQNDQVEARWELFADLRAEWAGRIALQGVSLISTEALADPATFRRIVAVVRRHGGVLGAFAPLSPGLDAQLDALFAAAADHGLALDFHADETGDPASDVLNRIATRAQAHRDVPVLVGHCCSLGVQPEDVARRTLDRVAEAGVAIVTLPSCNLYLQGRSAGRTPRWRGVTLLKEMAERGIRVAIGTDNVRDPFHPYGDFDPLEAFRDAVRIAQLDGPAEAWAGSVATVAGDIIGSPQQLAPGAPADLIVLRAASLNEMLARPGGPRLLIRGGRQVEATPPDFAELDG